MTYRPNSDERALRELTAAFIAEDPVLARRLERGPQLPLQRARMAALAGAAVALSLLAAAAATGVLGAAIAAAAAAAVLALFAASVSVLLYVCEQEASERLAY